MTPTDSNTSLLSVSKVLSYNKLGFPLYWIRQYLVYAWKIDKKSWSDIPTSFQRLTFVPLSHTFSFLSVHHSMRHFIVFITLCSSVYVYNISPHYIIYLFIYLFFLITYVTRAYNGAQTRTWRCKYFRWLIRISSIKLIRISSISR